MESVSSLLCKAQQDQRLSMSHIAFLSGLQGLANSLDMECIQISRKRIMEKAKIKSIATYHKVLKDLIKYQYLKYKPSFDPKGKTKIILG